LSLVYACITPHGSSAVGAVAGDQFELFAPTRHYMEEIGKRMMAHKPETIVIATPHGMRLWKHIAVYTTERCRGGLSGGGNKVELDFQCDKPMAMSIIEEGEKAGLPVVGCNYGAMSGPMSNIDMDWGLSVPLYFFGAGTKEQPEVVILGPTREIPLEKTVLLGEIVARVAEKSNKRVALVASSDQGHAHQPKGPYGYDPAAREYDEMICNIVKEQRLEDLLKMDLGFVDRAKPDSLWQMLILLGATRVKPMKGEFIGYQLPTYFGMMVAGYEPI
jgi:aromatic ring-opening dioxygenase LigB subunit